MEPDVDPGHRRWAEVLADMEAGLTRFDEALAGDGVPELPAWEPPSDLGPLPVHLAERATGVVGRLMAAQDQARDSLGRLKAETGDVDRRREASSAYADHAG
ncbi:MAG: hypothetical protein JJT89_10400 [Nitriliruptoraceae bacterium]|nr:hypothetical protein [Nitriliruptoraceae bacterium]